MTEPFAIKLAKILQQNTLQIMANWLLKITLEKVLGWIISSTIQYELWPGLGVISLTPIDLLESRC